MALRLVAPAACSSAIVGAALPPARTRFCRAALEAARVFAVGGPRGLYAHRVPDLADHLFRDPRIPTGRELLICDV